MVRTANYFWKLRYKPKKKKINIVNESCMVAKSGKLMQWS